MNSSRQPGGRVLIPTASLPASNQADRPGPIVRVDLRRGVTVTGRIVGPDGKPVQDVWIIGGSRAGVTAWRLRWAGSFHGNARPADSSSTAWTPTATSRCFFSNRNEARRNDPLFSASPRLAKP